LTLVVGETKPGLVFTRAFGFDDKAEYEAAVRDGRTERFNLAGAYALACTHPDNDDTAARIVEQGFYSAALSGARFVVWTSGNVTIVGERIKADHLEVGLQLPLTCCACSSCNLQLHAGMHPTT
jgi:hypothetical protein